MAELDERKPDAFLSLIFSLLAFLLLAGTILIAVGGIYYNFINPAL